MKAVAPIFNGLGIALLFTLLLAGSLLLAITEGNQTRPVQSAAAAGIGSLATFLPQDLTQMAQMGTPVNYPTPTFPPTPADCPPPSGWVPLLVGQADRLEALAAQRGATVRQIMLANCLATTYLQPESVLYLPFIPPTNTPTLTATASPTLTLTLTPAPTQACGAPAGWVIYIVKTGDTLYNIGYVYGTTVAALQLANCLGNSAMIRPGQKLFVPNVPPKTATFTSIPSATLGSTPSATPLSPTPSPTDPLLPSATSTPSATPVPSATTIPSATAPPSATPEPTATPTPTESSA